MKIVLAAGIFPPDIGGPATYTAQLAEALTKRGHTVTVVCFSDSSDSQQESYPVVRIQRSKIKPWSHWHYWRALLQASKGADCLYAQGPTAAGWQTRKVAQKLHLPYLVKVVGDYAWEQGRARFGLNCTIEDFQTLQHLSTAVSRLRALQHLVVREAQSIIVPSQYLADLVLGWGVPKENITIIYNSFTPIFASDISTTTRTNLFLTGGRLLPWKGFDALISLWPQIIAQIPDARLEIAGDGPDEQRLKKLIDQLGVASSVTMLGRLSSDSLAGHYLRAKAFILNSDYEGMSHMILEAMSAGAIPLVSRRGGNEELVQNGTTGLTFEYNSTSEIVAQILSVAQPANEQAMVEAARHRSLSFTPEAMIDHTEQALQQVINNQSNV